MLFNGMAVGFSALDYGAVGALGLDGKGASHLPLLQRSRPLVADKSISSIGTP